MNPWTKQPAPIGASPVPQTGATATPYPADLGRASLPDLEAHARLIQANFDLLVRYSEHAKKNVFAELDTKIKELAVKEQKYAELENKLRLMNLEAAKVNQDKKAMEDARLAFDEECKIARKRLDDERILSLQKIQYAVPRFLTQDDAKGVLSRLQPCFDAGAEGKQLQIYLGLAAVAEDSPKDPTLYITAITRLYPILRDLDTKNGTAAGSFVDEISELIGKGNEFGFQVKAPKKGERVDQLWMNSPINLINVGEVHSWAVINKEKATVRKAEVK